MVKTLIAGNWKMNLGAEKARKLAEGVEKAAAKHDKDVEVVLFPSFLSVPAVAKAVKKAGVGVQDIYFADEGAFTGEVSAPQAKEFATYALVGHSERRQSFGETNETVARKAAACLRSGITPIVCIGETSHEREEGETRQVLNDQLSTGLTMLTAREVAEITIAYEPIWAISDGSNFKDHKVATAEDVNEAVGSIRHTVTEMFGPDVAQEVRILYGGSASADTAGTYLDVEGINGLLVGGASLNDHEFNAIIERASK